MWLDSPCGNISRSIVMDMVNVMSYFRTRSFRVLSGPVRAVAIMQTTSSFGVFTVTELRSTFVNDSRDLIIRAVMMMD